MVSLHCPCIVSHSPELILQVFLYTVTCPRVILPEAWSSSKSCICRAVDHPKRLLAFFCAVMFLVWFDNGLFASNGVTGCSKDCDDPVGFPTAQVIAWHQTPHSNSGLELPCLPEESSCWAHPFSNCQCLSTYIRHWSGELCVWLIYLHPRVQNIAKWLVTLLFCKTSI